jgi:hypothetical protein
MIQKDCVLEVEDKIKILSKIAKDRNKINFSYLKSLECVGKTMTTTDFYKSKRYIYKHGYENIRFTFYSLQNEGFIYLLGEEKKAAIPILLDINNKNQDMKWVFLTFQF